MRFRELWVGEHVETQGEWQALSGPSHILYPMHLLCLAIPKLYPFTVSWKSST